MACAFDAKAQSALIITNPATLTHTCTGTNRLLVLSLIVKGAADRTGGTPTYAGVAMTQIGTPLKYATSPEQGVEMWYLPNPASGANTLSVPNAGALSLRLIASSYTGAAQSGALDVYGDATGVTANPSKLITTTGAGEAIVDVMGNGLNTAETGRSHTLLYANDEGTWNDATQYTIQASAGDITFSHTIAADDWALRVASFKQYVAGTEATARLAGLGDLEKRDIARLAGTTDLEATSKARIAGQSNLQASSIARIAGQSSLEAIISARIAALVDLEKIVWARLAGRADFQEAATEGTARIAARGDLEAVKTVRLAAQAILEAITSARLAGQSNLEKIVSARLASLSNLEATNKSRLAGIVNLEGLSKSRFAGGSNLEQFMSIRLAGQGNLEGSNKSRFAGRATFEIPRGKLPWTWLVVPTWGRYQHEGRKKGG